MSSVTSDITSASNGVAQVTPAAPSATWRAATCGDLWVFTCGRNASPWADA